MKPINRYHRKVTEWLSQLGIAYVEEYEVGPYSIDIYLPDQKLAVEIDGPSHWRKQKDMARDEWILEWFEIPTMRVPVGTRKKEVLDAIINYK